MKKTILAAAAVLALAIGVPVDGARAAEPTLVLSAAVTGPIDGRLIRTQQGLALLGDGGLTRLEGQVGAAGWTGEGWVTPVAPGKRWVLAVENPRTGGMIEPQLRGRMVVGDLSAAQPFSDQSQIVHNAAWPVAAVENADGSLTMLVWAKAPPFVTESGYRLVRWTPGTSTKTAVLADWPGGPGEVGPSQMLADGQGGFSLLTRMAESSDCGRRAGFALTTIAPDLTVSDGPSVCLGEAFTPFTTEILGSARTAQGPVWFVSGKQAGAHRIGRIAAVGGALKVKTLGELSAGEITSMAYDGATLLIAQGGKVSRISADGKVSAVKVAAPSCGGRKAGGKTTVSVAAIDGRLHLLAAADGCVNVWTY
ncbi:MAG: hypothetical protein GC145_10060 [Caulobacter sp.]|nr:hypothetical protein [Caulobacter sp.]